MKPTIRKHVFLDLEGTVITLIDDPVLGNISKVKEWLDKEDVMAVGIFSFAIDNNEERNTFMKSWTRRTLDEVLGTIIGNVVTTEDACRAARQVHKVSFEALWEFKQLWGKERGFIDFARNKFKDAEVVLLDDMVPNMTMIMPDLNLTIRMVNVDTL